jgi:hypothetical protein
MAGNKLQIVEKTVESARASSPGHVSNYNPLQITNCKKTVESNRASEYLPATNYKL